MSEQMLAPEDQMMQWITSKWITKPICDVGGGRGSFLIQLVGKYSHINGFVADIQGAVRSAERTIDEFEAILGSAGWQIFPY